LYSMVSLLASRVGQFAGGESVSASQIPVPDRAAETGSLTGMGQSVVSRMT